MSQGGPKSSSGSGAAAIETLTGNSGGAVSADSSFNIDLQGNTTTGIDIVGTPASNLLTVVASQGTTTQYGTLQVATNAEAIAGTDTAKAVTSDDLKAKLGSQTAHGLPIGEGTTSALTWTAAPTNGQLLMGSTGADPALGNLTSTGGTINVTNGAGSINLDVSGSNSALPAFLAYLTTDQTNVTGDGTTYSVIFDGVSYNQGSYYNATTGAFAAPVTGIYHFFVVMRAANIGTQTDAYIILNTTSQSYVFEQFNPTYAKNSGNLFSLLGSATVSMSASDTAAATITLSGSTKTVTVSGLSSPLVTFFGGYLVA